MWPPLGAGGRLWSDLCCVPRLNVYVNQCSRPQCPLSHLSSVTLRAQAQPGNIGSTALVFHLCCLFTLLPPTVHLQQMGQPWPFLARYFLTAFFKGTGLWLSHPRRLPELALDMPKKVTFLYRFYPFKPVVLLQQDRFRWGLRKIFTSFLASSWDAHPWLID